MGKFTGTTTRTVPTNLRSPVATTVERSPTLEGGDGWAKTPEAELFTLAASNMVGEDTFYETASDRDARFVKLVHAVTQDNPTWVAGFAAYLRSELLMRSASVVVASEYAAAGGANGRAVIASVCQRPDEPAEVLGYWRSTHGKAIPKPVKRGVADAATRLYTERATLRYDGKSKGLRLADVIDLTHPTPKAPWQSDLFKYLLDNRRHGDGSPAESLNVIRSDRYLMDMPEANRRAYLRFPQGRDMLATAGWGWERLAGWLPGGMDAEAWEFAIPNMGAMALVRNLRNFDQARIPEAAVDAVIAKITNPEQVKNARLFPYQVWSAYKNAPTDNWRRALGKTLALTTANVPALDGTLVVIDTSGSMQQAVSGRSEIARVEVAAVMAMVTAARSKPVDVVIYGQGHGALQITDGGSVLGNVAGVCRLLGTVGHATYGHTAIAAHFDHARHKRVVMFTDDQQADVGVDLSHVPLIYTVDLAGYGASSLESGQRGRHRLAGFSDATFRVMAALEAGQNTSWPWES